MFTWKHNTRTLALTAVDSGAKTRLHHLNDFNFAQNNFHTTPNTEFRLFISSIFHLSMAQKLIMESFGNCLLIKHKSVYFVFLVLICQMVSIKLLKSNFDIWIIRFVHPNLSMISTLLFMKNMAVELTIVLNPPTNWIFYLGIFVNTICDHLHYNRLCKI